MILTLFAVLLLVALVIILVAIASGRVPVLLNCLQGAFFFLGSVWLLRALLGMG